MADFPSFSVSLQNVSVSGASTLIQILTGAAPIDVTRVEVAQSNSTLATAAMQRVQAIRTTTAATTMTSSTPVPYDINGPASLAVGGAAKTAVFLSGQTEGSTITVLWEAAFHVWNGYIWIPVPEERIRVPASSQFAIKFPAAPGQALNVSARVSWIEYI
jgi:hypothetical protein